MTELPMHRRSDADLEAALRDLRDGIPWPGATPGAGGPDVAAVVRARIAASPGVQPAGRAAWRGRPARRALVLALVALLALAAVASALGLGLPGLRLVFGGPSMSPPPTPAPVSSAAASSVPSGPAGGSMRLGRRVDLASVDAAAGFHVAWPADPTIGPPDAAYVDAARGGQVSLVWGPRPGLPPTIEPGVGLLLTVFDGTVEQGFFTKAMDADTTVETVRVDGRQAYWLSGDPHLFFYTKGDGTEVFDERRWVGDALLWTDGELTHRLETSLGKDAAIRLAESMR